MIISWELKTNLPREVIPTTNILVLFVCMSDYSIMFDISVEKSSPAVYTR